MDNSIPASRKVSSPYTNTMLIVNKVWSDNTSNPVGPPSLEMKGGKSVGYRSRLVILLGGQLKAGIKKLTATSKGLNYNWGIQTKVKVMKNQLPSPFNVTYEGEFICTDIGIIGTDKDSQDAYKKNRIPVILKKLGEIAESNGRTENISADDVKFIEIADDIEFE